MPEQPQTTDPKTDPWRGIRIGDRFYTAGWNARQGTEHWYEVTDLWFDPVRGERNPKRGYMVAVRLMGTGYKWPLAAGTLAGKGYVNVARAEARARELASTWMNAPETQP